MTERRSKMAFRLLTAMTAAALLCAGCAGGKNGEEPESLTQTEKGTDSAWKEQPKSGIAGETAADTAVDFEALQAENPDIYAWLYIPGTGIDAPLLQSPEADDYYETHNACGEADDGGALYTELANLKNMCDFNTVIHGKSQGEDGLFTDLFRFADPDFFERHGDVYLYLDGNLLTYTVFAAYERENTSLIRSYDFTYGAGCEQFLKDLYESRQMGKNLRKGWEEMTPYHFLITLTTESQGDPDRQFVVVAALVGDAAGEIDRTVEW